MEEKTKAPFLKPALIYGAILGFAGILMTLIFYFLNLTFKGWTTWISLAVGIAVLAYCLVAYRNEHLGGYASYGKLFLMALVIGFIASILAAIFTYVLYTVIDPDLMEKSRIAAEERIMNNPRIPESMYEDAMERVERNMNLTRMTIMSLVGGTILYMIIGLIVAAFVKKEPEQVDAV
jgi:type VI protein secretion system component VasK